MAKSTQPAAAGDTTPPADDQAPAEATPPEPSCWRYTGGVQRIYMHVPVTVQDGDVILHAGVPAEDGNWEPHPGPATREPDNAPQPSTTTVEE